MKLPALTTRQQQQEDARLIHEQLYTELLREQQNPLAEVTNRLLIDCPDGPELAQKRMSGNLRRFWHERGYSVRTKTVGEQLQVWIEPMPSTLHLQKANRVA